MPFGYFEQFVAAFGNQRLVCGDDLLAVGQGLADDFECGLEAAHGFHHDLHVVIVDDCEWVVAESDSRIGSYRLFRRLGPPRRHTHDLDRQAGAARDFICIAEQQAQTAPADGAKTTDSYLYRCLHRKRFPRRERERGLYWMRRPASYSIPSIAARLGASMYPGIRRPSGNTSAGVPWMPSWLPRS